MNGVIREALSRPRDFGFTHTTDDYLDVGTGNPDQYVFFDVEHPSHAMHQLLATRAFLIVPEPSAMALLALCGLTLLRRRMPPIRNGHLCSSSPLVGHGAGRRRS
jgi:phospholipase/lecithinase/hemolysin